MPLILMKLLFSGWFEGQVEKYDAVKMNQNVHISLNVLEKYFFTLFVIGWDCIDYLAVWTGCLTSHKL